MNVNTFLMLLFAFSVISGLIMEAVKQFIKDKENISYNVTALVIALIVGGAGTAIYYQFMNIQYTVNNIICLVLIGIASALCSMLGYDKVHQAIEQILAYKPNTSNDK